MVKAADPGGSGARTGGGSALDVALPRRLWTALHALDYTESRPRVSNSALTGTERLIRNLEGGGLTTYPMQTRAPRA